METVTNCVGVSFLSDSDGKDATHDNQLLLNVQSDWHEAVREHYPKQLGIIDENQIHTPFGMQKMREADTLTFISSSVTPVTVHLLESFLREGRFKAIQVLSILPLSTRVRKTPLAVEQRGILFVPNDDAPLSDDKIIYNVIREIVDYRMLIEPLIERI